MRDNQPAIVSRDGSAWTASFAINMVPGATATSSARAASVSLAGTPQPREIWTLTVDGQRFDLSVGETYTLAGGTSIVANTLGALATVFADRIETLAGFHTVVSGNALVIDQAQRRRLWRLRRASASPRRSIARSISTLSMARQAVRPRSS